MTALTLDNFRGQLLVVGPLYNNLDKLEKIKDLTDRFDHIIINSGLLFPNLSRAEEQIAQVKETLLDKNISYLIGRQDLMLWSELEPQSESAKWILNQPNVATIKWENDYKVTVMDGGLTPDIKHLSQLRDNLEVSFVVDWHKTYNGKFGFIITNKPLTTVKPKYYNFSVQIGTLPECPTYGIVMEQLGVNQIISW